MLTDLFSTPTWWVHEVKVHQVIDAQFLQLQHHGAQVGPQDFWIRVVLWGTAQNERAPVICPHVARMST